MADYGDDYDDFSHLGGRYDYHSADHDTSFRGGHRDTEKTAAKSDKEYKAGGRSFQSDIARILAEEAKLVAKNLSPEARIQAMKEQQERNKNNGETIAERGARVAAEKNAANTAKLYAKSAANVIPNHTQSRIEYRLENKTGSLSFAHDSGGVVGDHTTTNKKPRVYINKPHKATRLSGVQFPSGFAGELVGRITRQVDIRAVVASQYFEGKFDQRKLIDPTGKASGVFDKAFSVVARHQAMYENYLNSLGKLLKDPGLDPNNNRPNVSIQVGGRTVRVNPKWKPLSPDTLKRKAEGESAPTFWKSTGRLAKAYEVNKRQHLSKVKPEDYYDTAKLDKTMREFSTFQQQKSAERYEQRNLHVTVSLDLAIPKWRATNGELMDLLITQPYSRISGIKKVSSQFRAMKKEKENYAEKAEASDSLSAISRHIESTAVSTLNSGPIGQKFNHGQSTHSDAHMDKKVEPLTVKDYRNAFYNLNRVGSSRDVGVRRFINPEFRRPFIADLSRAAGIEAMRSMETLVERAR